MNSWAFFTSSHTCCTNITYCETVVVDDHVCVCFWFVCSPLSPLMLYGVIIFLARDFQWFSSLLCSSLLYAISAKASTPLPPLLPPLFIFFFSACSHHFTAEVKRKTGSRAQKQEGQRVKGAAWQVRGKAAHENLLIWSDSPSWIFFLIAHVVNFFVRLTSSSWRIFSLCLPVVISQLFCLPWNCSSSLCYTSPLSFSSHPIFPHLFLLGRTRLTCLFFFLQQCVGNSVKGRIKKCVLVKNVHVHIWACGIFLFTALLTQLWQITQCGRNKWAVRQPGITHACAQPLTHTHTHTLQHSAAVSQLFFS